MTGWSPPAALDDTILAVSSGWTPAALGITRLSGPAALSLARQLCGTPDDAARWDAATTAAARGACDVAICVLGHALPATLLWFRGPRSYTGQDVVELHTTGSLPLLRALGSALLAAGARRALPGEFTARAYVNGRLTADQVDGVYGLIHAESGGAARSAARAARGTRQAGFSALNADLTGLLALIEAGIDFVDEEDVRFITAAEVAARVDALLRRVADLADGGTPWSRVRPHVALVGLPNAGKSTLFNALLGFQRAVVSPVVGTTRDVLSAEVEFAGVALTLQDCAGLGGSGDELELAAHVAAERTAERADLVLWVHDGCRDWTAAECAACARVATGPRILVVSKADLAGADRPAAGAIRGAAPGEPARVAEPPSFEHQVRVSAADAHSVAQLKRLIADVLGVGGGPGPSPLEQDLGAVRTALESARLIATADARGGLRSPELVSAELRAAWSRIEGLERGPLAEETLARIYSQFCLGK